MEEKKQHSLRNFQGEPIGFQQNDKVYTLDGQAVGWDYRMDGDMFDERGKYIATYNVNSRVCVYAAKKELTVPPRRSGWERVPFVSGPIEPGVPCALPEGAEDAELATMKAIRL